MKLFFRNKGNKQPGWMAISFQADGVAAAYVRREAYSRPAVAWLAFYPAEKAARPDLLSRLQRERDPASYHDSFLLSPEDYQILQVEAPAVQPDELKSAVRWRLKELLDFHIDDATFDVLAIPEDQGALARPGSMFAVVAKNQVIEQTQTMFDEAGLEIRVIDIPEMAQRNLSALLESDDRAVAMLTLTEGGMLFTVTAGGELYFTRRMEVTAAHLRHQQSENVYERITLEIQRSLDHFDRQHHTIPVSRVVLGPMGEESGLMAYLSQHLYVPVEALDLASVLDVSQVPELLNKDMQQKHLMVLGAALRHEEIAL